MEGLIIGNRENQQWGRYTIELEDKDYKIGKQENVKSPLNEYEEYGRYVVLKSLNNSSNIHEDFLNEVIIFNLYRLLLIIYL